MIVYRITCPKAPISRQGGDQSVVDVHLHSRMGDLASCGVVLGRKNCAVNFGDDKSCSRQHCKLTCTSSGLSATDLGSKFGTFLVLGDEEEQKLTPQESTLLPCEPGSTVTVRLGAYFTVLTITAIPVNVCTASFKEESMPTTDELSAINALGAVKTMNLIDQPVTTHLIATQRRPTLKFIASQLKSLPVVTPSWPAALVAMGPLDAIPDPGEHEVPLGLNTQTGGTQDEWDYTPALSGCTVLSSAPSEAESLCAAAGADVVRVYEGGEAPRPRGGDMIVYLATKRPADLHPSVATLKGKGMQGVTVKSVAAGCAETGEGRGLVDEEGREVVPWGGTPARKGGKATKGKKGGKENKDENEKEDEEDSDATTDDEAKAPTQGQWSQKNTPTKRGRVADKEEVDNEGEEEKDEKEDEEKDMLPPLPRPKRDIMTLTQPNGWSQIAPTDEGARSEFKRPGLDAEVRYTQIVAASLVVVRSGRVVSPDKDQGFKRFRKNFVKGVFEGSAATDQVELKKGKGNGKKGKKKPKHSKRTFEFIGLTPVLPKESEREIRMEKERRELERAQEEAERMFMGDRVGEGKKKRRRK